MTESTRIVLEQSRDYQFDVRFAPSMPVLRTDEPAPLGEGTGPSPLQLLAAAIGNCLSDSLLFALRKFRQAPEPIRTEVLAETGRNAEGRLRVVRVHVQLTLGVAAASMEHLDRVLAQFEAFCTVSQSVAGAFPVEVEVRDALGVVLKDSRLG